MQRAHLEPQREDTRDVRGGIEVPDIVTVALPREWWAEVMLAPGANRSRHGPVFEKLARVSARPVVPTVSAAATRAGEELQASRLSLPAAPAYETPGGDGLSTAESTSATRSDSCPTGPQ